MRNYKPFLVVLAVTALMWLLLSMSDTKEYPASFRVEYTGYDTNRYALLMATDSIDLSVASNGFQTLGRNRRLKGKRISVSLEGLAFATDSSEQIPLTLPITKQVESIRHQLGLKNDNRLILHTSGLNITLAQRRRKGFVPRLKDVGFEFAEGYSLGGEPRLVPDTVWLYGSQASLDRVGELTTRPTAITRIDTSALHSLLLDTAWRRYSDLRISTREVQVYVPVVEATERALTLPLRFRCADTSVHARLYPEQVEVHFWVSTKDYAGVNPSQFEASVTYDEAVSGPELRVNMDQFPAQVQISKVEPISVKYVVIK